MPKIIFRPNPTPPPFPPPTPDYPANSITCSPYPFNEFETVEFILHNLTLPSEYDEYKLCYYVPSLSEYFVLNELEYQQFIEELPVQSSTDYASTSISGYFVECWRDGGDAFYLPLTLV